MKCVRLLDENLAYRVGRTYRQENPTRNDVTSGAGRWAAQKGGELSGTRAQLLFCQSLTSLCYLRFELIKFLNKNSIYFPHIHFPERKSMQTCQRETVPAQQAANPDRRPSHSRQTVAATICQRRPGAVPVPTHPEANHDWVVHPRR